MPLSRTLNYASFSERMAAGKAVEDNIRKLLNIAPSTSQEDIVNKIDGYLDGSPVQIKVRATGTDILLDLYEPYVSPTVKTLGRDNNNNCKYYIVLINNKVKVFLKSDIQSVVDSLLSLWERQKFMFPVKDGKGNELRHHIDRSNGRAKVLGFINPYGLTPVKVIDYN